MEQEEFVDRPMSKYVDQLQQIIQKNSPVRDGEKYPGVIKRHGVVVSPFPGNLKVNGNRIVQTASGYRLEHGYRPAPYALYANKSSRKPKYIEKSIDEFLGYLRTLGWESDMGGDFDD